MDFNLSGPREWNVWADELRFSEYCSLFLIFRNFGFIVSVSSWLCVFLFCLTLCWVRLRRGRLVYNEMKRRWKISQKKLKLDDDWFQENVPVSNMSASRLLALFWVMSQPSAGWLVARWTEMTGSHYRPPWFMEVSRSQFALRQKRG